MTTSVYSEGGGSLPPILILCGGMATRLYPLTHEIPKAMIPVAGEPFVSYQLRRLYEAGFRNVILCVGHLSDKILSFVGNGERFGLSVHYSFDGPSKKGTGGAILQAISNSLLQVHDLFFVTYGDTLLTLSYKAMVEDLLKHSDARSSMAILRNQNTWDQSNASFDGTYVTHYEKGKVDRDLQYIDYGVSLFYKDDFMQLAPRESFDLSEVMIPLVRLKKMVGYEVFQRFYEIGTLQGMNETENFLKNLFKESDKNEKRDL